jgi:hypothetical protein
MEAFQQWYNIQAVRKEWSERYMSEDNTSDPLEKLLDEPLSQHSDKEQAIPFPGIDTPLFSDFLEMMQQHIETSSITLNFSTKNDVANAVKLSNQIKEKVDGIEKQMASLTNFVETLKQRVTASAPMDYDKKKAKEKGKENRFNTDRCLKTN